MNSVPARAAGPTLLMIDDSAFHAVAEMTESQVQSYLTDPNTTDFTNDQTCLAKYQTSDANWTEGTGWSYSGTVSAAHLVYKVAQFWGMNPAVLLATLQKESALPHGSACDGWRFNSAMGYDCPSSQTYSYPDIGVTSTCVKDEKYVGFTKQVLWGGFQLEFARQRSEGNGNINWQGNGTVTYSGYETPGTRARVGTGCDADGANCQPGTQTTYDGQVNLCATNGTGCQIWTIGNGATASLVSYTPFYPQSFGHWYSEISDYVAKNSAMEGYFPVYRLANYISGQRLWTADANEKNSIAGKNGWVYEGIGFQVPQGGATPVYRLANYIDGERLLTVDLNEVRADVGHNGWVYEGCAFKIPDGGAMPVYRLANYISHSRLLTISLPEVQSVSGKNGWVYEGAAFKIPAY